MSNEPQRTKPDPAIDRVSTMLLEQIDECHAAVVGIFRYASGPTMTADRQISAMTAATRLMQASASAASALKRLKGTESRHTVTVAPGETAPKAEEGGYPTPEISKTNGAAAQ